MIKRLNVLILDDNDVIVASLRDRIGNSSQRNLRFTNLQIVTHHIKLTLQDDSQAAEQIKAAIKANDIDVLLLDRGFYSIIDPSHDSKHRAFDATRLYLRKDDKGKRIEDILLKLRKKDFGRVSGVIVYTYIEKDNFDEGAAIRAKVVEALPDDFDSDAIEVIQSNLEIYHETGRKLYKYKDVKDFPEFQSIGKKGEFVLYGRFMGEILYNRIVSLIKVKRYGKLFLAKKTLMRRNTVLLFLVFTGLNIGAAIMCDLLKEKVNKVALILAGVLFAVGLPLWVLWWKPEWVISVDD